MVSGDFGTTDTRFERLTSYYRDAINRGDLKPGDRFPSARELSETHGIGSTMAGRILGALVSFGLVELRPGIGAFVLAPPGPQGPAPSELEAAARNVVKAFDEQHPRAKPGPLSDAMAELRHALGDASQAPGQAARNPRSVKIRG
jgi:DNA-binding GntR family transcriptional regulator